MNKGDQSDIDGKSEQQHDCWGFDIGYAYIILLKLEIFGTWTCYTVVDLYLSNCLLCEYILRYIQVSLQNVIAAN